MNVWFFRRHSDFFSFPSVLAKMNTSSIYLWKSRYWKNSNKRFCVPKNPASKNQPIISYLVILMINFYISSQVSLGNLIWIQLYFTLSSFTDIYFQFHVCCVTVSISVICQRTKGPIRSGCKYKVEKNEFSWSKYFEKALGSQ